MGRGIVVIVGSVTGDKRNKSEIPKGLQVCALRFTETARATLKEAGAECLTLDQLALISPKGSKCLLLMGKKNNREAVKHFGPAPGKPKSKSRPYVRSYGRSFERARERR